ncbi:hypothetical protein SVIO_071650 [Streptomyces violaceusniger]|uniref:Uncharacterized protein n=1 Tax=Streptomyces violaceusniger TaxID=68280 RepID=A0A4D4L5V7_STRVO|nr:hypothetical protein SVIO_071650 [Streptomyces violaceusniger]
MQPQPPYDLHAAADRPVTVDRREGPYGEVVLRRRGGGEGPSAGAVFEIIANGCFLMDTSDGRSERLLIRAALDALPADRPSPPCSSAGSASVFRWSRRWRSPGGGGSRWSSGRPR